MVAQAVAAPPGARATVEARTTVEARSAIEDRATLGMAEMGVAGLSENWLLKRLGDIHWRLIAQAMGQTRAVFADAAGRPVYAAFCGLDLRIDRPHRPRLGDALTIRSRIDAVSPARLASRHALFAADEPVGAATLISTFVAHGTPGRNRSVARATPLRTPLVPAAPAVEARATQDALAALAAAAPAAGVEHTLTPCPAQDFNAAGLLYFASFPALADRAEWALNRAAPGPLTRRTVVFLGNVETGEPVTVRFGHARPDGAPAAIALTGAQDRLIAVMRSERGPARA
jgi:probable biosynthetic protein (TIGR04099 family)